MLKVEIFPIFFMARYFRLCFFFANLSCIGKIHHVILHIFGKILMLFLSLQLFLQFFIYTFFSFICLVFIWNDKIGKFLSIVYFRGRRVDYLSVVVIWELRRVLRVGILSMRMPLLSMKVKLFWFCWLPLMLFGQEHLFQSFMLSSIIRNFPNWNFRRAINRFLLWWQSKRGYLWQLFPRRFIFKLCLTQYFVLSLRFLGLNLLKKRRSRSIWCLPR